jgi:Flp pilus assembly protein TadD
VVSSECHFLKGRFEQALSLALGRKTAEGYYWQSRAANELARASFEKLAQLPASVESHQVMAELYRNQGRHGDAIKEWKAAIELAPEDGRLRQELATSVYMSRDYPAAEKMARQLLAEEPESPELQFILGDSLMNQQQMEQALAPLREAVRLRADYPAAHAVLGRALVQMGKGQEAIEHLRAAVATDGDGSLHFLLGRAYQEAGQAELAAQAMKRYQELRSSNASGEVEITGPGR